MEKTRIALVLVPAMLACQSCGPKIDSETSQDSKDSPQTTSAPSTPVSDPGPPKADPANDPFPPDQLEMTLKKVNLPNLPKNGTVTFKLSEEERKSLANAYSAKASHIDVTVQNQHLVFTPHPDSDPKAAAHLTGAEPEVAPKNGAPAKSLVLNPEAVKLLASKRAG